MKELWQSIIVLKDRCYLALCGDKPPRTKAVCDVVSGVDEDGQWTTAQEHTASVPVEPSMDTVQWKQRDIPMTGGAQEQHKQRG